MKGSPSELAAVYERLTADFVAYEVGRGRLARAVATRQPYLKRFISYLQAEGIWPDQINGAVAREYLGMLHTYQMADGRSYQPKTIESYRIAATQLCSYLGAREVLEANPMHLTTHLRCPRRIPREVPKPHEVARVLDYLRARWAQGAQESRYALSCAYIAHVIAELQYASGLRIAEVARLEVDELALDRGMIYLRHGKGDRERICYLARYSAEVLEQYLKVRERIWAALGRDGGDRRLFGLSVSRLQHRHNAALAAAARATGVGMRSHTFRHALGYHLLRSGCSLRVIQEILGHEKISTTEVYTKVDVDDIKSTVDRYHPFGALA